MTWKTALASYLALIAATMAHAEIPIALPSPLPATVSVVQPSQVSNASQAGSLQYGPFRVVTPRLAVLEGATDEMSPGHFAAMMRDYPDMAQLDLIECPGTVDDRANLLLGRLIRQHNMATHVPPGGSVRSGAVELFLAGVSRSVAPNTEFAVHAWVDDFGRSARDYPADAPKHQTYLDYYRDMGMSEIDARSFYNFTNSAPQQDAIWLNGSDMRRWVSLDGSLPDGLNGTRLASR